MWACPVVLGLPFALAVPALQAAALSAAVRLDAAGDLSPPYLSGCAFRC